MAEVEVDADFESAQTSVPEELFDVHSTFVPDVTVNIPSPDPPPVVRPNVENVQQSKPCIYRVPMFFRKLNPDAYTPQVVSLGPYHYKRGEHLLPMEVHKENVRDRFLKWKNLYIVDLVNDIFTAAPALMSFYESLDRSWTREEFTHLMVRDGIFVIALLEACAWARKADEVDSNEGFTDGMVSPHNDPVLSKKAMEYLWPYIQSDMVLIENQIPLLVLRILLDRVFPIDRKSDLMLHKSVMEFLKPEAAERVDGNWTLCSHFLEIYRKSHIKGKDPMSSNHAPYFAGSASALRSRGISIRFSKSDCFDDIDFVVHPCFRLLRVPRFQVDETAERVLLNLAALERLYTGTGNEVMTFVFFMARLFRIPSDCRICRIPLQSMLKGLATESDVVDFFMRLESGFPLVASERFNEQKILNWSLGYWLLILPSVIIGCLKVKAGGLGKVFRFLLILLLGFLLSSISGAEIRKIKL